MCTVWRLANLCKIKQCCLKLCWVTQSYAALCKVAESYVKFLTDWVTDWHGGSLRCKHNTHTHIKTVFLRSGHHTICDFFILFAISVKLWQMTDAERHLQVQACQYGSQTKCKNLSEFFSWYFDISFVFS